jgi:hypothetical protein
MRLARHPVRAPAPSPSKWLNHEERPPAGPGPAGFSYRDEGDDLALNGSSLRLGGPALWDRRGRPASADGGLPLDKSKDATIARH